MNFRSEPRSKSAGRELRASFEKHLQARSITAPMTIIRSKRWRGDWLAKGAKPVSQEPGRRRGARNSRNARSRARAPHDVRWMVPASRSCARLFPLRAARRTHHHGPAVIEEAESTTVIGPGGNGNDRRPRQSCHVAACQRNAHEQRSQKLSAQLEVAWNTLISIASEQAAAMVNSSFSAVLGEMEDLSAGVFDADGAMMAQSVQGAPGHLGSLSLGVKHFARRFRRATLAPGDVLITNDPWLVSGHKHDITVVTPVFLGKASRVHCQQLPYRGYRRPDLLGRRYGRLRGRATNSHDEAVAARQAATSSSSLLIEQNVRSPDLVIGDSWRRCPPTRRLTPPGRLHARQAFRRPERAVAERSPSVLNGSCGDAITRRPRWRISRIASSSTDSTSRCHIIVKLTVKGDRIVVDYDGTSPQVPKGINCVLNFTQAFTHYALKCLLAPKSPNNDGSFCPIEVRAPEASIVHARFPAAVGGRHLVGLYIPFAIFGA